MRIYLNHRKRMERIGIDSSILGATVKECERDFGTIIELDGYKIKNKAIHCFNFDFPINGERRLIVETIYGTAAFNEGEFSIDFEREKQLEFSF